MRIRGVMIVEFWNKCLQWLSSPYFPTFGEADSPMSKHFVELILEIQLIGYMREFCYSCPSPFPNIGKCEDCEVRSLLWWAQDYVSQMNIFSFEKIEYLGIEYSLADESSFTIPQSMPTFPNGFSLHRVPTFLNGFYFFLQGGVHDNVCSALLQWLAHSPQPLNNIKLGLWNVI